MDMFSLFLLTLGVALLLSAPIRHKSKQKKRASSRHKNKRQVTKNEDKIISTTPLDVTLKNNNWGKEYETVEKSRQLGQKKPFLNSTKEGNISCYKFPINEDISLTMEIDSSSLPDEDLIPNGTKEWRKAFIASEIFNRKSMFQRRF